MKKVLEYVKVDDRNAILFIPENTEYLKSKLKEATKNPSLRSKIYGEIASRFVLDMDKVNQLLVLYVNKMKEFERKKKEFELETDIRKLCNKIGHRFVDIKLSGLRAYKECMRCKKVVTKYKITGEY
ncbi:MAG: hypothetical protein AB1485_03740 [Candidatus Thermoplasmatota archaeon]